MFLHTYCQKGEVYRYGRLFRRVGCPEYLHLNQAVTEYWFDGVTKELASLTMDQRTRLDDLIDEFADCVKDSFSREDQPEVPYVRLPVKADYTPGSESPFKKNPHMTQLVVDFVRRTSRNEGW